MNAPRLLPLIGISLAGVLALNALAGARDLPGLVSAAKAMAEGLPTAAKGKGKDAPKAPAPAAEEKPQTDPAKPMPGSPTTAATPAICAPGAADLAKAAGLTPTEQRVLDTLGARRGQIDQREKDVDTQAQLLAAAEAKLDAKLKSMMTLKEQIQALMGQADQKTQAEVDRLTVVYTKMKDVDAAAVMAQLDDKVRVPIAAAMKPAVLSKILAKMSPLEAKKLTELLAHRFAAAQQMADAAKNPPAAPAKPDAKADPKAAKTAKTAAAAEAAPDPADANVDTAPAKPAKPKPTKLAKRAAKPTKKAAPKAKPATEQAKADTLAKPLSEVKDAAPKTPTPTPAKTR